MVCWKTIHQKLTFSLKCLRKSRTKGAQNLNLIYAYDINAQEPVEVLFTQEICRLHAFRDFLRTYKIKNGFLILDRGFDDKECKNLMREKNIKYLMPIKINHTFKKFNLKSGFNFTFTYRWRHNKSKENYHQQQILSLL